MRDGTPIEKNVIVSEAKLIANEEHLREKFNIYSVYPDIWLEEVLVPVGSSFHIMFY